MTDNMGWYLEQAGRIPLLTPPEEIELGHQIQAMMKIKEGPLKDRPFTSAQKRTIKRGEKAKARMVAANIRLVVHVAKKFANGAVRGNHMSMLDLIQEGTIGLNRGVEKFDPKRGYKFSTYAYWWIRQGIWRARGNMERTIRIPCCGQDVIKKVTRFLEEEKRLNDRVPSIEECAEHCGVTVASLSYYVQHEKRICSLDQPAGAQVDAIGREQSLMDVLRCPKPLPGELLEMEDGLDQLEYLLEELTDKERNIIERRYGLLGDEGRVPYKVIAAELDVSRERVRQIELKALKKLRIKFSLSGKKPLPED